ncbi:hypothetical protein [Pedobacter mucosus]|uniref:hypothetical protein n=1 Tax=Pedobacter mucosus TaxID=2895286 RepID=UPI001EE404B6|nr:hypothetical protein [Pedobacter mucosus]UKT66041.1 hypothetical protein LOK61_09660 [Pedobacter mucosus]
MKTEELFFIVRVEVNTQHGHIDETLEEMERISRFLMTDTPMVKVIHSEILTTKTRNKKNEYQGA